MRGNGVDRARAWPRSGGRWAWLLAGVLVGLYAVHLSGGYIANLAFTVPFFAAGAALAARSRRGTIAAALLLGGGGLAHPQFFLVGAGILGLVAAWAWLRTSERGWSSDAGRTMVAVGGGAVVVGAGLVSSLSGPTRLRVDTSKDAFLRRSGLDASLGANYLERFRQKIGSYVPWVLLPLAVAGAPRAWGFTRRFLVSWGSVSLAGVPIGIATGWFPPDRIITFAFALPALAALGVVWVWEAIARRAVWLAWPVAATLVLAMAAGAVAARGQQQTYMSPDDLASATMVGRIAETLPAGTPLVMVVNGSPGTATFLYAHAMNIVRAAIPPERAADAYVYVGDADALLEHRPTAIGDPEYDTMSRTSLDAIPRGPVATFVIREFNRGIDDPKDPRLVRWDDAVTSSVPNPRPLSPLPGELAPSTPWRIAWAAAEIVILLVATGYGWARWALPDGVGAVAAAPGFGVAVLILVALAFERLGVSLGGSAGATAASAVAGGLGYGLLIVQGKAQPESAPQIDQDPDEQTGDHRHHDPVPDP